MGPVSYLVMAADLCPIDKRNRMIKFADDTYLILPEKCTTTSEDELQHIQDWAQGCNLTLNRKKTKEVIFRAKGRRDNSTQLPVACPAIDRVEQLTALGVVISDRMTAADHVSKLLEKCTQRLYMPRVLSQHGLTSTSMNDVFRATVLDKLMHCASGWSGFCLAADRARLDMFLHRYMRLRYSGGDIPEVAEMIDSADKALFSRIIRNNKHVLQHYLPEHHKIQYNLRPRQHSKQRLNLIIVIILYECCTEMPIDTGYIFFRTLNS